MQDDSAKPPGGFEIPDLDLGAPAAPKRPEPRPQQSAGGVDDDFDSLAGSVSLGGGRREDAFGGGFDASHFDSSAVAEPSVPGASLDEFDASMPVGSLELASVRPPAPPPPPAGASLPVEPSAYDLEPTKIAELAGFGPAPDSIFGAPAYAVKVTLRKMELRKQVPLRDAELRDAEKRRTDFLAALARERAPALEADPRHEAIFNQLRTAQGFLQQGAAAVGQAQQQLDQARQQFQAQAEALQLSQQQAKTALAARDQELALAETDLRRAEAKQKRLLIEARNALAAATGGQPGVQPPPQVQAQIQQLQQGAAALQPEVDAARQVQQAAHAARQSASQAFETANSSLQNLQRQGSAQRAQLEAAVGAQSAQVSDADARLRSSLADAARAWMSSGDLILEEHAASQFAQANAYVDRCAASHQRTLAALDCADGDAVTRGFLLMGGAALLLLVVLVLLLR